MDTKLCTQMSNYLEPYSASDEIKRFCWERKRKVGYWSSGVLCGYRGGWNFVDIHDFKETIHTLTAISFTRSRNDNYPNGIVNGRCFYSRMNLNLLHSKKSLFGRHTDDVGDCQRP